MLSVRRAECISLALVYCVSCDVSPAGWNGLLTNKTLIEPLTILRYWEVGLGRFNGIFTNKVLRVNNEREGIED